MRSPGRALSPLALLFAVAACAAAPPAPPKRCARGGASCEAALAAGGADADARLADEAMAARPPGDPWRALWEDARAARPDEATLVVVEGGAHPGAVGGARVVRAAPLGEPARGVEPLALLSGLAAAAGYRHVVVLRADGALELFPADPLAPFAPAVPAVLRSARLDAGRAAALARAVEATLEAAARFDYVAAADEAERLSSAVAAADVDAPSAVRARFARSLLERAGVALVPLPTAPRLPAPSASAAASPYEAFLRIELAERRDEAARALGKAVIDASPEPLRAALEARLAPRGTCAPPPAPPPFTAPGSLLHLGLLGAALTPIGELPAAGRLEASAWAARHAEAVRLVEATRSGWWHVATLARSRGGRSGLFPSATPSFQKVSSLATRHVRALRALAERHGRRFDALAHVGLALAPELAADPPVAAELLELVRTSAQLAMGGADTPADALWAGVVALSWGAGLAGPLRAAQLAALQGAFSARIKGDLATGRGWAAAGLFAVDGLVRALFDVPRDLAWNADRIAETLDGPGLELAPFAPLVTALARYAALADAGKLDLSASGDRRAGGKHAAERAAAKAALVRGVAALSPEPKTALADDLADFADASIAALFAHARTPAAKDPKAPACAAGDASVQRALARLGDSRRKLAASPTLRKGEGLARRGRVLFLVLSDALDLALRTGGAPRKQAPKAAFVSQADAEAWLEAGLGDLGPAGRLGAGALGLLRAALDAPKSALGVAPTSLARTTGALAALFPSEGSLLGAIAAGDGPLSERFVAAAERLRARGERDAADAAGLVAFLTATDARGRERAAKAASAARGRLAWLLVLLEARAAKRSSPDWQDGLRSFAESSCAGGSPEAARALVAPLLKAHEAVARAARGEREEARRALDDLLAKAPVEGLAAPLARVVHQERSGARTFEAMTALSVAGGFLSGANRFSLNVGVTGGGGGGPSSTRLELEAPAEDAARSYASLSALGAVWGFAAGDARAGALDARRAVSALQRGVRLGGVHVSPAPTWATDARYALALGGQLAAERGLPLLAGELWASLRGSLPAPQASDVDEILAEPPLGLAADGGGLPAELEGPRDRARESLKALFARRVCGASRAALTRFERPSCALYPTAVALFEADALERVPRLAGGERCPRWRAFDAFLVPTASQVYEPDAFKAALDATLAAGASYDAAVMLSRLRKETHCSPALVSTARALAGTAGLHDEVALDLLLVALGCSTTAATEEARADFTALGERAARAVDPGRALHALLFAENVALRTERFELIDAVATDPLLHRLLVGPRVLGHALVARRAARAQGGASAPRAHPLERLLCTDFAGPEQRPACATLAELDAQDPATPAGRKAHRAALERAFAEIVDAKR